MGIGLGVIFSDRVGTSSSLHNIEARNCRDKKHLFFVHFGYRSIRLWHVKIFPSAKRSLEQSIVPSGTVVILLQN